MISPSFSHNEYIIGTWLVVISPASECRPLGHFHLGTIESIKYNVKENITYLLNVIVLGRFTELIFCAQSVVN